MVFEDKTIDCKDCGGSFVFTVGEQGFYLEKGLLNDPQRCPGCREQRRNDRVAGVRRVTSVQCAECGQDATVPFVPRQNRPVYCGECFERVRSATPA